jgi:hypothetical protein
MYLIKFNNTQRTKYLQELSYISIYFLSTISKKYYYSFCTLQAVNLTCKDWCLKDVIYLAQNSMSFVIGWTDFRSMGVPI